MKTETQIIIQYFFIGGSILASILAWVAKLRWSKEFQDVKQAQIDFYKEMSSSVILDMLIEQKKNYEVLLSQLRDEKVEKDSIIEQLQNDINNTNSIIDVESKELPIDLPNNTLSMATLLASSGNYGKAIFIYQKLLLKYPEKKDFFNTRIKELKKFIN